MTESGEPRLDLKFTTPSECKVFSRGGLNQLGNCDLKPKSGFPGATGSHTVVIHSSTPSISEVFEHSG